MLDSLSPGLGSQYMTKKNRHCTVTVDQWIVVADGYIGKDGILILRGLEKERANGVRVVLLDKHFELPD